MRTNPTGAFFRGFGSGTHLLSRLALAELKGTTKLLLWELWGRGQSAWQPPNSLPGLHLDSSVFFFLLE